METYEIDGFRLQVPQVQMGQGVRAALKKGRYERGERAMARATLRKTDRVLEAGAGIGLTAMVAAQIVGPEAVTAVEANPNTVELVRDNIATNGLSGVQVIHGAVVPDDMAGSPVALNLSGEFWDSSLVDNPGRSREQVEVPAVGFHGLIEVSQASVVIMDIEGAEVVLFDEPLPPQIRAVVIEVHPRLYGRPPLEGIRAALRASGLRLRTDLSESNVWLWERRDELNEPAFAALDVQLRERREAKSQP